MQKWIQFVALVYLALTSGIASAAVTATVDRNPVAQGETVTLTIRVTDEDGEPDLGRLGPDFRVLGQSTSSQVQYVNGNLNKWKDWNVQLLPTRAGQLTIPAIRVGQATTAPVALTVTKQTSNSPKEAWIDFEVQPKSVWQGQQINLKVQLYYASSVRSGELSQPDIEAGIIEQIGDDQTEQTVKNGVRYNRLTRRYVVFPEAAGSFRIRGPVFNGQAEAAGRQPSRSFGGLFRSTRQVSAAADDVVVSVKNAEAGADFWLPAQDVVLTAEWADSGNKKPQFRVGEPVTRVVSLTAYGLLATQLPDLEFDYGSLRAYPEAAEQETRGTADGVIGIRHFRTAIIPQATGSYELPEQTVRWWDVTRGQWATATLAAERIEVLAGNTAVAPAVVNEPCQPLVPTAEPMTAEAEVAACSDSKSAEPESSAWWPILTALFAFLWLLTVSLWLLSRRRGKTSSSESPAQASLKAAKAALIAACEKHNAQAAQRALAALARAAGLPVVAPAAVAQQLSDDVLAQALRDLDSACYGATSDWRGDSLAAALRQTEWPQLPSTAKAESGALPPLYPH